MNGKNTGGNISGRLIVGPQLTRSISSTSQTDSDRVIAATAAPQYETFTVPRHGDVSKTPSAPRWSDTPSSQFVNGGSNGWRGPNPLRTGPSGPNPAGGWPHGNRPPPPDIVGGETWGKGPGSFGPPFSDDRPHTGSWPLTDKVDNPDIPNTSVAPALSDRQPPPGAWHPAPNGYQNSNGHVTSNGYPSTNGKMHEIRAEVPHPNASHDSSWPRAGVTSWGVGYPDSAPRTESSAPFQNGRGIPVSLSPPPSDFSRHSNGHHDIRPPENGSQNGSDVNGWNRDIPGEYRQLSPYPSSSTDGPDSNAPQDTGVSREPPNSDPHSHVQRGTTTRPHSPPLTPGKAANGHRSPAPVRMGPAFENVDWPSFGGGGTHQPGLRASRSVDTALAANGSSSFRREKGSTPGGSGYTPVLDIGGPLPRRSLTSSSSEMASLRSTIVSLQATVEALAAQVRQVALSQQVMLTQHTSPAAPAPGGGGVGGAGGEELPNMVGKMAEGVAGGMAELAALIRAK